MKMNGLTTKVVICGLTLALAAITLDCATMGLVSERYSEDFYKVARLLPDEPLGEETTFIVYSDNQSGWRISQKFLKRSNWTNWKMAIFPFYQLYLVGNGIVGGINWLRKVPDYGRTERLMVRDAVYDEAKRSDASFILNIGDMAAADGRRPTHWATFLKENKTEHPLLEEIPYLPVLGNHEHANDTTYGFPNFDAVFDYPRFYVVEFANAVLIVVDSNLLVDQYLDIDEDHQDELFNKWFVSGDGDSEPAWLEKQLAVYNKPFKIVAMHNPPISFGKHHKDWLSPANGRDLVEKRGKILNLFAQHGVQVVLSGHDHLYQHSVLRHAEDSETHLIVGGGGGVPPRDVPSKAMIQEFQQQFKSEDLDVLPVKFEKAYHYFVVKVSSGELLVSVTEVTGEEESPTRLIEDIRIARLQHEVDGGDSGEEERTKKTVPCCQPKEGIR